MLMNEVKIKQEDGYVTTVYPYYTSGESKGSVLVFHGMAEYHQRYIAFAEYLNKRGYDVFLYDHRGHGTDKKLEELGFFAAKNGYAVIRNDALEILKFVKKNSRSKRVLIFAHSMGSILARNVIQYDDDIDGVIICGTNSTSRFMTRLGLAVSYPILLVKGANHPSPFMNKLMFGSKYYTSLCERTSFDWLTRNNYIVGQYIGDAYCGFLCTVSMYRDIMHLVDNATDPLLISRTRKDLPIFFASGEKDPVGSYGKDIITLVNTYQRLGFTKIDCTLYNECRHELLNELNNDEIMDDFANWMDAVVDGATAE